MAEEEGSSEKRRKLAFQPEGRTFLKSNLSSNQELMQAMSNQDIQRVSEIIQSARSKGKCSSSIYETGLLYACEQGMKRMVQLLINCVLNINKKDSSGNTALIIAAGHGFYDIVKILMKNKAKVNIKNKEGETALMIAVQKSCSIELLELLLSENSCVDVNLQDKNGRTVLMKAIELHDFDAMELLMRHMETDLRVKDFKKRSAYDMAITENIAHVYVLLLEIRQHPHPAVVSPLILAIGKGDVNLVKFILQSFDFSLNLKNKNGHSPLMIALYADSNKSCKQKSVGVEIVKMLLDAGANVNEVEVDEGWTPLMFACRSGNHECVKLLLEYNADVDIQNFEEQYTALMYAAENGWYHSVESLLDSNAQVDLRDTVGESALTLALKNDQHKCADLIVPYVYEVDGELAELLAHCGKYSTFQKAAFSHEVFSFASAIRHNNFDLIRYLLDRGEDINKVDFAGSTPLLRALGKNDVLKFLLQSGADVNTMIRHGDLALKRGFLIVGRKLSVVETPYRAELNQRDCEGLHVLLVAIAKQRDDIANILIASGADLQAKCPKTHRTALHLAATLGNDKMLKMIIEHGADINAEDSNGETPLMLSIGNMKCVQILIESKVNINHQSTDGTTALIVAVKRGDLEAVDLLLRLKTDVNLRTSQGYTALMFAASNSKTLSCLSQLIESGAIVNAQNSNGSTALHILLEQSSIPEATKVSVAKTLIDLGADVNCKNFNGKSPVMIASLNRQLVVTNFLISQKADVNIENKYSNSLLSCILKIYYSNQRDQLCEVIDVLLKAGAKVEGNCMSDFLAFHKMIHQGQGKLVLALIHQGMTPQNVEVAVLRRDLNLDVSDPLHKLKSRYISPFCMAVMSGRPDLARFFIQNCFFTKFDIELSNNRKLRQYMKYYANEECVAVLVAFFNEPKSLLTLSVMTFLTMLSTGRERKQQILDLQLPTALKNVLLFKSFYGANKVSDCGKARPLPYILGLDFLD